MTGKDHQPARVLEFWFAAPLDDAAALTVRTQVWYGVDPGFDESIRTRFGALVECAGRGELKRWKLSPQGTLALILLFDQFPRNIFRGTPRAFDFDQRALALARDGVAMAVDRELTLIERAFFYLPFEHAEDHEAQTKSVACFEALHAETTPAFTDITANALNYAREHRDLVQRFGRFPHRNLILDRPSTAAEIAWLTAHRGTYGQA